MFKIERNVCCEQSGSVTELSSSNLFLENFGRLSAFIGLFSAGCRFLSAFGLCSSILLVMMISGFLDFGGRFDFLCGSGSCSCHECSTS
jgi:hypothetical protein